MTRHDGEIKNVRENAAAKKIGGGAVGAVAPGSTDSVPSPASSAASPLLERKYQMTRLRKGDYLLPSNDAETLWRIATYQEDGTATYQTEFTPGKGPSGREYVLRGTFWALYKRPMPKAGQLIDLEAWGDEWEFWAGPLPTRDSAIRAAMRWEAEDAQ